MKELENKILEEGVVLGDDILKVDSFLNQQIDVELIKKNRSKKILFSYRIKLKKY